MLYIIQAIDECWFIIKIILTFYLYNNITLCGDKSTKKC